MRNGCLTRSARLAENKHIATHTKVFLRDNLKLVAYFVIFGEKKQQQDDLTEQINSLSKC